MAYEMTDETRDKFIRMMTEHQLDLQAVIFSSLGDYTNTMDVLQQTNVVLWRKASEFRPDASFLPWALKIAKYEMLAFVRARRHDRHVLLSPEVVELMCDMAIERSSTISQRAEAFQECVKQLPERSLEFLRIRYAQNQSIEQISAKTGRSIGSVKSLYHRIRVKLGECIERKVAVESRS
jgi:RNA polymerase sigma-70 factor (ECF subfamily)